MDSDTDEYYISSDESDHNTSSFNIKYGRKNIKDVKRFHELSALTKAAYYEEANKKLRISCHEKEIEKLFPNNEAFNQLILDYDPVTKAPSVAVHPNIVKYMKIHQKEGVKFMWHACFETVKRTNSDKGSGCILAHCMGLGKTLQTISLCHTLLSHSNLNINKVLIVCPKNTLLNWCGEFEKWIKYPLNPLKVYNPSRSDSSKHQEIIQWAKKGGVCVLSYNFLRITIESLGKNTKSPLYEALIDPGPQLVICDEGHVLKSQTTKLAKVMYTMKTLRRIILTGTPLQNNLVEYYSMVNFVRPHLLGTKREFGNMFMNPIQNGQYENSLVEDVSLMKARSHVLHKTLLSCIQRFDVTTLAAFLPPKHEFVLSIRLTPSQILLYDNYLKSVELSNTEGLVKRLFSDYQLLQRVWTHPHSLQLYDLRPETKARKSKKQNDESDDDENRVVKPTQYEPGWWKAIINEDEVHTLEAGNKLVVLLDIIRLCIQNQEKLLVFSGSLFSLETIQYFLSRDPLHFQEDLDFFVLTGATTGQERDLLCRRFNDPKNERVRVFMISTRAGGMGITLNAANRAVIFDASWNPSHDVQSIFRIYRLGQTKPCYIYRLVASGTMEEKIYERQVAKESTARRVVDEKQIKRHYTRNELHQLYTLNPDKNYSNNPAIPQKDKLLENLIERNDDIIGGYHEHDSLLKHKMEEELREIEKKGAWTEFSGGSGDIIEGDRVLIDLITPETFKLSNFKIVLRQKYPHLTEQGLSTLMSQLMPRVQGMVHGPDFKNLMLQSAIESRRREEMEKIAEGSVTNGRSSKKPTPLRVWGTSAGRSYGNLSDSDCAIDSD